MEIAYIQIKIRLKGMQPDKIAVYATLMVSNFGDTIVVDTLYMSRGRGIIDIQ